MKNTLFTIAVISLPFVAGIQTVAAHCQVPCGIFDDEAELVLFDTDIATIKKSMEQINELSSGDAAANVNQLSRWVANKEKHAQAIQDRVAQYFLAQRIKPDLEAEDKENYYKLLKLVHHITFYAMKCKQTTDLENVEKLQEVCDEFHRSFAHDH
ncbi:MAG: superoxide dismutase [Ni] [Verrucomicrobiota bacterium]